MIVSLFRIYNANHVEVAAINANTETAALNAFYIAARIEPPRKKFYSVGR